MPDHICCCCGDVMAPTKQQNKGWQWFRCARCLHKTLPIPYAANKKAQEGYTKETKCAHYYKVGVHKQRAAFIKQHCSPNSVVDIGCGTGFFLVQFPEATTLTGFSLDVATQPPDPTISMFRTDFQEALLLRGRYDLVTAWHVLEHTLDPVQGMRQLIRMCNRDGFVGIELPAQRHLAAPQEYGLHPHRFSIPSIARFLWQFQNQLRYTIVGPAFKAPGVFVLARKTTQGEPMPFGALLKCCEQGDKNQFRHMQLQRYGGIMKMLATPEDAKRNALGLKEAYR